MTIRKLDKSEWQTFFDRFARDIAGKRAEIEIASLALGAQIEAEWLPLFGIDYDPKDDILEIALDGLDHMVSGSQEIYVDVEDGRLSCVEIRDRDGVSQRILLPEPLTLPAPLGG